MATPNYALPEIVVGQRNKEITHNTAIRLIEGVLGGIVDKDLTTPPTLVEGNAYLIPSGASGAWSGKTNNIAIAVNGAWEFIEPSTRLGVIFVKDESRFYCYSGTVWEAVELDFTLPSTIDTIPGFIEIPSNKTYIIDRKVKRAFTINSFSFAASAGTGTISLAVNGSTISTVNALAIATSETVVSAINVSCPLNASLTIAINSVSSLADLSFSMEVEYA
jgi:hypothetical protein